MERLECIIVHGIMPSVPNSATPSLATPTICAILLMVVTARFLVMEMDYLQTFNMQLQYNERICMNSSHSVVVDSMVNGVRDRNM